MSAPLLSESDLAAMAARCDAATSGPWDERRGRVFHYGSRLQPGGVVATVTDPEHPSAIRDAAFIAHARTDLPRLLAYVRELREALREALDHHAVCQRCAENCDDCEACRGMRALLGEKR